MIFMIDTLTRRVPSGVAQEAAGVTHGGIRRVVDLVVSATRTRVDARRRKTNYIGNVIVFSAATDSQEISVVERIDEPSKSTRKIQSVWKEANGTHPEGWYFPSPSGFPDYFRHDPKPKR